MSDFTNQPKGSNQGVTWGLAEGTWEDQEGSWADPDIPWVNQGKN